VDHLHTTALREGALGPLAGIEEAGEHSLIEDVRFDQTRNNFRGNDFVGVRVANAFSESSWAKREGQFPDPGTANLRLPTCSSSLLDHSTLLKRVGLFPEFSELYRVNEDKTVDFWFRESSVAFVFCVCGNCKC
jgi:hypothetical protein